MSTASLQGQEYTATKLPLFPDRENVLIKDVSRDSLGFIWFLTNGEIYRYDGYRSLNILKTLAGHSAAEDMPQHMLVDRKGRLWMAGNVTLSYLDLKSWTVHVVDQERLPPIQSRAVSWIKQLSDSTVVVAYENGHLLLQTADSLVAVNDLRRRSISSNSKEAPRSVTYWNGRYWVGTSTGSLLSIDPERDFSTEYHRLPGINHIIRNLIAEGDRLFLDVYQKGLYRLDRAGDLKEYRPQGFAVSSDNFQVLQEGQGLHAYVETDIAFLLDSNLDVIQRVAMPSTFRFRTTAVDITAGELLLGTDEGVFVIYPKSKGLSHLIPVNRGTNKSTRGIYVYPDGSIFYCTYEGAGYIHRDGQFSAFDDLRHAYALLSINERELLIGTEGGFLKVFDRATRRLRDWTYTLSPEARRQYQHNLPMYVMSLAETDADYLIGSMNGLWLMDKKFHVLRPFDGLSGDRPELSLQVRHITTMADGGLLLSTNIGLFQVRDGKWIKRYPLSGNIGVFKSVPIGDQTWVATQGNGLVAIDTAGRIVQTITTIQGLSNDIVYSVEYIDGSLVAGTANGLDLIRDRQIRRIGKAEGLMQSEFNSGASFWDQRRNTVYIGGLSGYTVLDMSQPWFDTRGQLESYVTEVHTIGRDSADMTADYTWPYRGIRTLRLKPGQSLTGLYVGTPGNYRADTEISYALNEGNAEKLDRGQFISLIAPAPGDYRLTLETTSTSPVGSKMELTILKTPAFYETWWSRALVVAVGMGLMLLWYRSQLRKVKREQELRNRIAADLHDEVGSSLTRIYFQASTLSEHESASMPKPGKLRQIADISKQALVSMSDMVWSIDSQYDTTKHLVIRMKDYVHRLREDLDITCRFEIEGDYTSRRMSQSVRQNLFLIFKEALTNAVKHGDGSEIFIQLELNATLRLIITNGCSTGNPLFADQLGGQGIQSMKQRAAKMGGELSLVGEQRVFQLALVIP